MLVRFADEDGQSAYEKLMTMFTHALFNVNMVWVIGNIDISRTINPEIAVMDHEIIRYCKRFIKGIPVNDDTLAADVIKEVNFIGDYLTTEHTMKHFREAIWSMDLANRFTRNVWETCGSKSIKEKAAGKVDEILSAKHDYEIEEGQLAKLDRIKKRWMERLG